MTERVSTSNGLENKLSSALQTELNNAIYANNLFDRVGNGSLAEPYRSKPATELSAQVLPVLVRECRKVGLDIVWLEHNYLMGIDVKRGKLIVDTDFPPDLKAEIEADLATMVMEKTGQSIPETMGNVNERVSVGEQFSKLLSKAKEALTGWSRKKKDNPFANTESPSLLDPKDTGAREFSDYIDAEREASVAREVTEASEKAS